MQLVITQSCCPCDTRVKNMKMETQLTKVKDNKVQKSKPRRDRALMTVRDYIVKEKHLQILLCGH